MDKWLTFHRLLLLFCKKNLEAKFRTTENSKYCHIYCKIFRLLCNLHDKYGNSFKDVLQRCSTIWFYFFLILWHMWQLSAQQTSWVETQGVTFQFSWVNYPWNLFKKGSKLTLIQIICTCTRFMQTIFTHYWQVST